MHLRQTLLFGLLLLGFGLSVSTRPEFLKERYGPTGTESLKGRYGRGVLSVFKGSKGKPDNNDCNSNCPNIYQPVCGTDRVTYASACYFKCAFQKKPKLRVVHQGSCS